MNIATLETFDDGSKGQATCIVFMPTSCSLSHLSLTLSLVHVKPVKPAHIIKGLHYFRVSADTVDCFGEG